MVAVDNEDTQIIMGGSSSSRCSTGPVAYCHISNPTLKLLFPCNDSNDDQHCKLLFPCDGDDDRQ